MLPHRAHEGASAQGVLQQREERGWDTLEHPRSLFPDPPLCLEPPPPRAPAARAQSQETKCPHYCCRQPRLSMLEKVHCAPRHLLK